jgi:S-disulfanyl-L-cysteine oxidoreductase SoxD
MKRTVGLLWLGAILIGVGAQPAQAQSNGSAEQTATIWDGVYTAGQAERGKQMSNMNCAVCHSPAEWGGAAFMTRWSGGSIEHLHSHIQQNMPYDAPGRLTAQEYADIVAYMLSLNNVPAGENELPNNAGELDKIQFTAQPAQAQAP